MLGAVNALFFSVLIYSKKSRTVADKILAAWLIVLSAQLIIPFLYLANFDIYYKYAGYEMAFFAFHPVFLNFYVKAMIGRLPDLKAIAISIILIIITEIYTLSFFCFSAEERFEFIKGDLLLPSSYYPFMAFVILFFVYYAYNSYKVLKDYRVSVLHIYSYRENIDLLWLRRLVILFSVIIVFVFPTSMISYFYFHSDVFADYFFYFTLVIFIFFLGYWGYQQGEIFNFQNFRELPEQKGNGKSNSLTDETRAYFKEKAAELKQLMQVKQPWLNPRLAIHDLARSLEIPPHHLSKIISMNFHSSFFEFVNAYRVEEFKHKVSSGEYKNLTILAIAFECGFNSKSAFNRIFKESTGITPGDFLKNHQQ